MPDHRQSSLRSPSIVTGISTDTTLTAATSTDATLTTDTTTTTGFTFPPIHAFPPFYTLQPNAATLDAQLRDWSALICAYCRHHRLFRLALSDQPHQQHAAAGSTAAGSVGWSATANSATAAATANPAEQLFHNRALGRRLRPADARRVLEYMRDREGTAEPATTGAISSSSFSPSASGAVTSGSAAAGQGTGGGGAAGGGGAGAGGGMLAGLAGLAGGEGKKGAATAAANVWWIWWRKVDEWAAMLEAWVRRISFFPSSLYPSFICFRFCLYNPIII
jgi:ESCRT-II complex subunit VPS25